MKKLFIPPVLIIISIILMILFYLFLPEYHLIPYPYNLAGLILSIYGFSIMGKSRDLYRKHQTTLKFAPASHLIRDGIYRRTRNPMYLGMFLLILGLGITFRNLFSLIAPLLFLMAAHFIFIPAEEKRLDEQFGEDYRIYKKEVRKWL